VASLAAALGLRNASGLARCAVVTYAVHAGFEGTHFLTVDGNGDGEEGPFEVSVACELIVYPSPLPTLGPTPDPTSLRPTPEPSSTPRPSLDTSPAPVPQPTTYHTPAPTQVHARANCACFSDKMVENIAK
jgi:hypothetical protein